MKRPTHSIIDGHTHTVTKVDVHKNGRPGHVKVHMGCALTFDTEEHLLESEHWWQTSGPADCEVCKNVETGVHPPKEHEVGHGQVTMAEADIATGMKCAYCNHEVYQRRKTGEYACSGSGHVNNLSDMLKTANDTWMRMMELLKGGANR